MSTISSLIQASILFWLDYFNSILLWTAKLISPKYIFDQLTSHFLFKTCQWLYKAFGKSSTSSARSIRSTIITRGAAAMFSNLSTHTRCCPSLSPSCPFPPFFSPFLPSLALPRPSVCKELCLALGCDGERKQTVLLLSGSSCDR